MIQVNKKLVVDVSSSDLFDNDYDDRPLFIFHIGEPLSVRAVPMLEIACSFYAY